MKLQINQWLNANPTYKQAIEKEIEDILKKYSGIKFKTEDDKPKALTSHEIAGYFYNQKSVEALSQLLSQFSNDVRWNISAYIGVVAQNMTVNHTIKKCPVTGTNPEDAWYV